MPNSTYYVAIACQRFIGSLTTNRRGNGTANIDAPGTTTFPFYVETSGLGMGHQLVLPTTASPGPSLGRPGGAAIRTDAGTETGTGIERAGPEGGCREAFSGTPPAATTAVRFGPPAGSTSFERRGRAMLHRRRRKSYRQGATFCSLLDGILRKIRLAQPHRDAPAPLVVSNASLQVPWNECRTRSRWHRARSHPAVRQNVRHRQSGNCQIRACPGHRSPNMLCTCAAACRAVASATQRWPGPRLASRPRRDDRDRHAPGVPGNS
jgi:hypothetical protein